MPRSANHVAPVNLLWVVPLVVAEFWLLAYPPAWVSALHGVFTGLLSLLLIPVVFLLWVGLCKLVVAVFWGGR